MLTTVKRQEVHGYQRSAMVAIEGRSGAAMACVRQYGDGARINVCRRCAAALTKRRRNGNQYGVFSALCCLKEKGEIKPARRNGRTFAEANRNASVEPSVPCPPRRRAAPPQTSQRASQPAAVGRAFQYSAAIGEARRKNPYASKCWREYAFQPRCRRPAAPTTALRWRCS